MMRIIIDLQGLQSNSSGERGVGRYTENIVRELLRINKQHEILLAINAGLPYSIDSIRFKFREFVSDSDYIIWHNYLGLESRIDGVYDENIFFAEGVIREVFLDSWRPNVIFSTNLQEGLHELGAVTSVKSILSDSIFVSTLHDVVPLHYKDEMLADPYTSKWYYSKLEIAKKSDYLITVSGSSKSDIIKFLEVDEERLVVVENGYDSLQFDSQPVSSEHAESVRRKYDLPNKFLLYIGGADKHKNIERLIFACSSNPKILLEHALVLGGSAFPNHVGLKSIISALGLDGKVLSPGFIDEVDLPLLYKLSSCFVFPAVHEGFGLPVLEAMACGTPVIGSNSSSIKEIIQNEEAMFDPFSIIDIASKIDKVISQPEYRERVIQNGLNRSRNYSWKGSAQKLMSLFDKIDSDLATSKLDLPSLDPVNRSCDELSSCIGLLNNASLMALAKSLYETYPIKRNRKIFVDVSTVVVNDHKTGIQRVVRAISAELLQNDNIDVELVYTTVNSSVYRRASTYMRDVFTSDIPDDSAIIEFINGDVLLHLDLHPGNAIAHQFLLRDLRNKGVNVYYVVYDILPLLKPESFWPELCSEFESWIQSVCFSDGAICISRSVAAELRDYVSNYGGERQSTLNIGWFHLGADVHNSAPSKGGLDESAEVILEKIQQSITFLMVGTIEPRKGHIQTLRAFESLWDNGADYCLIFVGKLGWGMDDFGFRIMNHHETGKRLFWLRGISDEYLCRVYSCSSCLIAASEGEGFGLPLIEAAQYGIPLLIRDIPVFREVAGEHAFYFFDDLLPTTIADAVCSWFSLFSKGDAPDSNAMPRLTWADSSKQLLSVINDQDWTFTTKMANSLPHGVVQYWFSHRLIWRGFASPEPEFRWSNSPRSSILFHWAGGAYSGKFRLLFGTYGEQRVTVYFNDIECFSRICTGDSELLIPIDNIKNGVNVLRFSLPDCTEPSILDRRKLAISFKEFEVTKKGLSVKPGDDLVHDHRGLSWRGFGNVEKEFRWSAAKVSVVIFHLESDLVNAILEINFKTLGKQAVTVSVNGDESHSNICEGPTRLFVPVKKLLLGYNFVKFFLPNAKSPNETDNRLLAIAFQSLVIRERNPEDSI